MKNRDSKNDKRAERQTEIAGKLPYHRLDKIQKQRRHEVDLPTDEAGVAAGRGELS